MTSLVSEGRQLRPGSDPMGKLGKLLKKPFARFSPDAIIRYIIYLPLNFIPVIGTVLFVILQGRKAGPNAHTRYFQLKGMNNRQKEEYIDQRKAAYTRYCCDEPRIFVLVLIFSIALVFPPSCSSLSPLLACSSLSLTLWERRCGPQIWSSVEPPLLVSGTKRRKRSDTMEYHAACGLTGSSLSL